MSNFNCDKCGASCADSERGYLTGCKHYPPDIYAVNKKQILEFYMSIHVSELKNENEKCKELWKVGQSIFYKNKKK